MSEHRCSRHEYRPVSECPRDCMIARLRPTLYLFLDEETQAHLYKFDGLLPQQPWCGRDLPNTPLSKRYDDARVRKAAALREGETVCETCCHEYAQTLGIDADPDVLQNLVEAIKARTALPPGQEVPRCIEHHRPIEACPRECLLRQMGGVIYLIGAEGGPERHLRKNDGYLPDATWCGYPEFPDSPQHSGRLQPAQMYIGTLPVGLTCCVRCVARYREALGPDARQALPPHQLTEQLIRHHAPPPVPDDVRERYRVNCAGCGRAFPIRSSITMREFRQNSGCGSCPHCRTFQHFILLPDDDPSGAEVDAVTWDAYMASRPPADLRAEVREIAETHRAAFDEMKRLGD